MYFVVECRGITSIFVMLRSDTASVTIFLVLIRRHCVVKDGLPPLGTSNGSLSLGIQSIGFLEWTGLQEILTLPFTGFRDKAPDLSEPPGSSLVKWQGP